MAAAGSSGGGVAVGLMPDAEAGQGENRPLELELELPGSAATPVTTQLQLGTLQQCCFAVASGKSGGESGARGCVSGVAHTPKFCWMAKKNICCPRIPVTAQGRISTLCVQLHAQHPQVLQDHPCGQQARWQACSAGAGSFTIS